VAINDRLAKTDFPTGAEGPHQPAPESPTLSMRGVLSLPLPRLWRAPRSSRHRPRTQVRPAINERVKSKATSAGRTATNPTSVNYPAWTIFSSSAWSSRKPGPIVVERVTFFTNVPFTPSGLARTMVE